MKDTDNLPALPEPDEVEDELPDNLQGNVSSIMNTYRAAMQPLIDSLNSFQKDFMEMQGPTVDSQLDQLEQKIQNVNTDEDLEEIEEHISIIRGLESVSDDEITIQKPEGQLEGRNKMMVNIVDGGSIVYMDRKKSMNHDYVTLEVVPEDEL